MTEVYGSAVYGADYYTSTDSRETVIWSIEIDWDNDGEYSGDNEAIYAVDFYSRRGRPYYVNAAGDGFVEMRPGRCTITFDNTDGRYDPYNDTGDLYGMLLPGRLVRVRVKYDDVIYPVFVGKITSMKSVYTGTNERKIQIVAEDGIRILKDRKITLGVYQNTDTDDLLTTILSAADWSGGSSMDSSIYTIPIWWAEDKVAWSVLHELMYFELGVIFIDAEGQFRFKSGNPSGTPDANFDESELGKDLRLIAPWDIWRNYYTSKYYPIAELSAVELWRLYDTPQVPAGSSIDIWAELTYQGRRIGLDSLTTPVSTTDFTANTAEDGSGTNKTSYMSVSVEGVYGQSVKLRISNSDASLFYITLLKLRGDAFDQPNSSRYEYDGIADSGIAERLDFKIDYQFITTYADAYKAIIVLSSLVNANLRLPAFSIIGRPDKQFIDIYDHIRVKSATLGLSQTIIHVGEVGLDYRVGYLEHSWVEPTGQVTKTEVITEPYYDLVDPR